MLEALNPLLRGWTSYFRRAQVKDVWQELDAVPGGTLGASRMNYALAKSYFDHMGLVAGVYTHRRASRIKS